MAGPGAARAIDDATRGEVAAPESPTAAGTARSPDADPAPVRRGRDWPRGTGLAMTVAVLAVAGLVALAMLPGVVDRLNPFRGGLVQRTTVDRSGPAVLKAVSDLGEFRAASGYYELVVDVEQDVQYIPSFLAGRRDLFVAAGTVDVAVDLRALGAGTVTVDDARTAATITLPRPHLTEPALDVRRSYLFSRERGLADRLADAVGDGSDDQKALYALASKRLAQAARESGELTARGEANTRRMVEGLLRSLGFTRVTVTFTS